MGLVGVLGKQRGNRFALSLNYRRRWRRYTSGMSVLVKQPIDELRMDRSAFSVVDLNEPDDAVGYWLSRPAEERLVELERLRRTFYGDAGVGEGLQRFFEVVELQRG